MERSRNKTNVFSIQDYGNQQILHDECMFLCSNIMTTATSASTAARLTAASDLLQLLSSSVNRRTLFVSNNDNNVRTEEESSVLSAILSVWIWICRYPKDRDTENELCNDPTSLEHNDDGSRNKRARHEETMSCQPDEDERTWLLSLQNILLCCWHFISMDCTMECAALSHKSRYACQMRSAILRHPECITSLFQWIQNNNDLIGTSPSGQYQKIHDMKRIANAISINNRRDRPGQELNSPDSYRSKTSTNTTISSKLMDPTVAGRRRQKQPHLQGGRKRLLGSIPECGSQVEAKNDMFAFSPASSIRQSRSSTPSKHDSIDEIDGNDCNQSQLSFAASCSKLTTTTMEVEDGPIHKARDIYDSIAFKIATPPPPQRQQHPCISTTSTKSHDHTCGRAEDNSDTTSWVRSVLPILVIQRIVNGKMEGSDISCMDEELGKTDEEKNPSFSQSSNNKVKQSYDDDEHNDNPLLLTNKLLAENGCLPSLSKALANTLAVVVRRFQTPSKQNECPACLGILQDRVSRLGALVDGASLWSTSNRRSLSEEGFHGQAGGYLIVGLVAVLNCFLEGYKNNRQVLFHGGWGDIALSTLRTLTSLTHENDIAAKELEAPLPHVYAERDSSMCGLNVLSQVLHAVATMSRDDDGTDSKLLYDSVIFCLNILTNVIESGASRRILEIISIKDCAGDNIDFLPWLTRWLVNETRTFQDAVAESTFGSLPSKHEERRLASHEAEKLVTAGNGFVLLSCLMLDDDYNEGVSRSLEIISKELPGDTQDIKILYVKNTLKAFCNFYHFSVGDLSVAVVAPVKALILRLEKLQRISKTDITESSLQ
jgi:hypothetical protein